MTIPVDLSAISAMGNQFNKNIFDKPASKAKENLGKQVKAAHTARVNAANSRERFARSAEGLVNKGRQDFVKNQQQKAKAAQAAAKVHAAQVKKGRAAPAPGSAPRTFAMPAGPQGVQQRTQASQTAKNVASQRNAAHGEALKMQSDSAKVMQQQRNFAHGEAIKEANTRSREAAKGATVAAPTSRSEGSASRTIKRNASSGSVSSSAQHEAKRRIPSSTPPAMSTQFVDVQAQSNEPYATHEHPEGSSHMKLKGLSEAQPRPNDFTVGSRNVKPGGIAARGSQLEAWGIAKQNAVQARQASRRAGGRDKDLAARAKQAENYANMPLNRYTPHTAD